MLSTFRGRHLWRFGAAAQAYCGLTTIPTWPAWALPPRVARQASCKPTLRGNGFANAQVQTTTAVVGGQLQIGLGSPMQRNELAHEQAPTNEQRPRVAEAARERCSVAAVR